MTTADWVALISAFGGGAVLVPLGNALFKWLAGKAGRERSAVEYERKRADEAQKRADLAERQLDHEAAARRRQAEYSSTLRRRMIEHGIPEHDIPEWPVDAATMPREQVRRIRREAEEQDNRFKPREA